MFDRFETGNRSSSGSDPAHVYSMGDRRLFHGRTLASLLSDVEIILGLAFAGFLTFGVVIAVSMVVGQFMLYRRPHPSPWLWMATAPAGIALIWLQWKSFQALMVGLEDVSHPRPVHVAMSQPRWPFLLRPLACVWWLGQVVMIVLLVDLITTGYGSVNPSWTQRAIEWTLQFIVFFMAAYASTCAILFAFAAVRPSEAALVRLWKARAIIDLAIACIAATLSGVIRG